MSGQGANAPRERAEQLRLVVQAFEAELRRFEETGQLDWQSLPFDAATAGRLAAEWVYVEYVER
jgi:hypothetical protein